MTGPRIGSLCAGTGALDLGLMSVVGGSVAWHCENDPRAAKVLDRRWPGVPNYGDITTVQWTPPCENCGAPTVLDRRGVPTYRCDRCCRLWPMSYFPAAIEPVDWLAAGYPCQPESLAGKGLSEDDDRWIWPDIARAIGVLRPRHVLLENVAGHVGRGLRTVLGSLAALRYDARWTVVRASDAGACHERARVFVVASDATGVGLERAGRARGRRRGPADLGKPPTDAARDGRDEGRAESARLVGRPDAAECRCPHRHGLPAIACCATANGCCCLTPDTDCGQLQRPGGPRILASSTRQDEAAPRQQRNGHAPRGRCAGDCAVGRDWRTADGRDYGPAVRRWHDLTRCVPPPTVPDGRDGAHRLSPLFDEWMMGLPAGWVTDVLPRNPALKCLGNGCVPAQVALAVRTLLSVEQAAA